MTFKPHIFAESGHWVVRFGATDYFCENFTVACRRANWIFWSQRT